MLPHRPLSKGDPAFCEEFLTFTVLYKKFKFLSCRFMFILDVHAYRILLSLYEIYSNMAENGSDSLILSVAGNAN